MPPILDFITPLSILLCYSLAAALWGGSLLVRYVRHQLITRDRLIHTAWQVAIMGAAMTVGSAINSVYDRGMMSPLTTAIVATIWFAVFAGASWLLERRWPEEAEASR